MSQTEAVIDENVLAELPKGDDLVVRVRTLTVDGVKVVDIRDYIPSLQLDGRGVLVPFEVIEELAIVLHDVDTGV